MAYIKDGNDLINYVKEKQEKENTLTRIDLSSIPNISRAEILEISRVLSYDHTISALRGEDKSLIWHVAMPKSGSTYLTEVLKKGLSQRGWTIANMVPFSGRREQELTTSELHRQGLIDSNVFAVQQHCCFSEYTFGFIEKFNVKVIFQVRSILDCIVSLVDHCNNESTVWPIAYLNDKIWSSLDEQNKLSFILDYYIPWYIKFWVGWSIAMKERDFSYQLIEYEKLISDPISTIDSLISFCGEKVDNPEKWLTLGKETHIRKNKGIIGRGKELPLWVHTRLQQLISYYPDVDFEPVGIIRKNANNSSRNSILTT